jgi:3-dehydroquinate dehydratase type I
VICISVAAPTQKKALADIKRALPLCDLLELRMDLIADGNLSNFLKYIEDISPGKPVVVTHRKTKPSAVSNGRAGRQSKAGAESEENKRWTILEEAVRLGAAYVDVELEDEAFRVRTLQELILKRGRLTKLICSHHDFRKTPSLSMLKKLYRACEAKGADLIKIAPYARRIDDNIRVLQFLSWAHEQGREVVAFCMGETGRLSRVAAPLFGAAFTFAALDEKSAAAPGQIAAGEMVKMLKILKPKGV